MGLSSFNLLLVRVSAFTDPPFASPFQSSRGSLVNTPLLITRIFHRVSLFLAQVYVRVPQVFVFGLEIYFIRPAIFPPLRLFTDAVGAIKVFNLEVFLQINTSFLPGLL